MLILTPDTLRPPYCPLSFLPQATPFLLTHCLHLCFSYLQPHPGSLHIASIIQSSVSPTSSNILALYTLPPSPVIQQGSLLYSKTACNTATQPVIQHGSLLYSRAACNTAGRPVIQQDSLLYSKIACNTAGQPVIHQDSL